MDWSPDADGTPTAYKTSASIRTDGFEFELGQDFSCNDITISSYVLSSSGLTIVSDSQSGNVIAVQVSGVGDLKITLTLSSGDTPSFYNRYKESNRSLAF